MVITGASSGIGRATAVECAKAGMNLILSARRADRLDAVAAEVGRLGRRAAVVAGDVNEPGLSRRMLDAATDSFGRFDVVFANAGYGMAVANHEMPIDDVRAMFEVNVFAALDLIREAALRLIAEQREGHLLMCSSCLSKFSIPYHGTYSATKAAQDRICAAMRSELREHSIYVSSVHPITTMTEFFEVSSRLSGTENHEVVESPDHAPKPFVQTPERVARAVVRCLRRPKPEVWTSVVVRTVGAAFTLFPRFADLAVRSHIRPDRK
jgi:short-subunit dehydrogenase